MNLQTLLSATGLSLREIKAEKAKRNMLAFITFLKTDYLVGIHHKVICEMLDNFLAGKIKRLMIFVPPQHGKSEISSRYFPAFALGHKPNAKVAIASYSDELSGSFNRDVQRIIDTDEYRELFPQTYLNGYRPAWGGLFKGYQRNESIIEIVGKKGSLRTVGIGTALTGQPVDIAIIDDPVKDRITAESETERKKVWDWYTDVLSTRLHNDSQQLLLMCMVGDTPVLMADGTERPIKEIKVGDVIATYDNGSLTTSKVLVWKNQGCDAICEIRMKSGIFVRANERHPFLTSNNGITKWKRLKNLKPGDAIVRVMRNGEPIEVLNAPMMNAISPQNARAIAPLTIAKPDCKTVGVQPQQIQPLGVPHVCGIDTELAQRNLMQCSPSKRANAQSVANYPTPKIPAPIGMESFALTIATKPEILEDCYAMIATSWLVTEETKQDCCKPLNTYAITLDSIVEIVPAGSEDVFDIQVERTENFIANGLVSHNTRWHSDDLAGRLLLKDAELVEQGGQPEWVVINFPAIQESEPTELDPRQPGEALWPARHNLEKLLADRARSGERTWESLYQQRPVAAKGNIINSGKFGNITRAEFAELTKNVYVEFHFLIDGAYTKNPDNDATACYASYFHEPTQTIYISECTSVRLEFPLLTKFVPTFAKRNNYGAFSRIKIEPKANGLSLIQSLATETGLNVERYEYPLIEGTRMADKDKVTRAYAITPKVDAGRIVLIEPAIGQVDWRITFKAQCAAFPNAKHDDEVDVLVMDCLQRFFSPKRKRVSSN